MFLFSAEELDSMRQTQDAHMMDLCQILHWSPTTNSYNMPADGFEADWAQACGYKSARHNEGLDKAQVPLVDGFIRLPVDTVISNLDRVKITHRHGEALTAPITFELVGIPQRGPSGLVLSVRKVTDGSDG